MFSSEQYRAVRESAGLVDRSDRGRLRLTGQDRRNYLQGLLTNDIVALSAGAGCYACLLTPQGRMIADMHVIETGDAIFMDLERDVAATVCGHLEQFVFSEDVQVSDLSASLAQLGVYGPSAAGIVSRVLTAGGSAEELAPTPARLEGLSLLENRTSSWGSEPAVPVIVVRRDDLGVPGFDLLIDCGRASDLAQALRMAGAVDVDQDVAEVCRVEGGRPVFHKDMDETTIPLEAGIEERAISETKGCYVGQEIIIRVLHRGHGRVARRLVGLTLDPSVSVPSRGDRIRAGDRDVGTVTSAVASPALQRPIAMGYVQRDFVEIGKHLELVSGDQLLPAIVARLPFVGEHEVKRRSAS